MDGTPRDELGEVLGSDLDEGVQADVRRGWRLLDALPQPRPDAERWAALRDVVLLETCPDAASEDVRRAAQWLEQAASALPPVPAHVRQRVLRACHGRGPAVAGASLSRPARLGRPRCDGRGGSSGRRPGRATQVEGLTVDRQVPAAESEGDRLLARACGAGLRQVDEVVWAIGVTLLTVAVVSSLLPASGSAAVVPIVLLGAVAAVGARLVRRSRFGAIVAALVGGVAVLLLGGIVAGGGGAHGDGGAGCLVGGGAMGLVAVLPFVLSRPGLEVARAAALGGFGSLAGAAVLELQCSAHGWSHVLVFHGGAVVLAGIAAAGACALWRGLHAARSQAR